MNGCGIGKNDDYFISVMLKDPPTEEDKLIPKEFEGVKVVMEVIGEIKTL